MVSGQRSRLDGAGRPAGRGKGHHHHNQHSVPPQRRHRPHGHRCRHVLRQAHRCDDLEPLPRPRARYHARALASGAVPYDACALRVRIRGLGPPPFPGTQGLPHQITRSWSPSFGLWALRSRLLGRLRALRASWVGFGRFTPLGKAWAFHASWGSLGVSRRLRTIFAFIGCCV